MPVRTARLAEGLSGGANTTVTVYRAPAGRTAIVKDVRFSTNGGSPCQVIWALNSGPGRPFINLHVETLQPGGWNRVGDPWVVLEPGEELVINTSVGQGMAYWVSGTELDGVAP